MKMNTKKILGIVLAAVLAVTVCTACGADRSASATMADADSASVQTQAAALTATESKTEETAASELFSKRDLSGDYDASEALAITLTGSSAQADSDAVQISGSTVTITAEGTYILTGTLENGSVIVDVSKEEKVQLVLDGVTIHSETFAAVYVRQADKVFITLAEGSTNVLSNGGTFTQIDDSNVDAVIFSRDDLTLNGSGTLQISSPGGHGIVGKDEVTITGGVYEIIAADNAIRAKDSIAIAGGSFVLTAGDDGLHAENADDDSLGSIYIAGGSFSIQAADDAIHAHSLLQIDGGSFDLTAAEGMEASYIRINDGEISISASDDGVNAAYKSSAYTPTVEINGGTLSIVMGAGDTDGVDSNGDLIISGGTVDVTGRSAFDFDGTAQYTGGTIIVNGQTLDAIPNSMMGGGMGGRGGFGGGPGAAPGELPEGFPGDMPEGGAPRGGRGGPGGWRS